MSPDTNWQKAIVLAARDQLTGDGAIVVRTAAREIPQAASRVFGRGDYENPRRYLEVAWMRATAMFNADSAANFYVVSRHGGSFVAWNGRHSVLHEVDA